MCSSDLEIEQLKDPEIALGERILADVDLDAGFAVREHQKIGFPEAANRQDPPARTSRDLLLVERIAFDGSGTANALCQIKEVKLLSFRRLQRNLSYRLTLGLRFPEKQPQPSGEAPNIQMEADPWVCSRVLAVNIR